MELSILQIAIIAIALLVIGGVASRFIRKTEGDGFFARVFKDGKDFDATLDRVGINTVLLFMLWAFHDDFTDPATAATVIILFQAAFNLYGQITVGKAMRDMSNGHIGNIKVIDTEKENAVKTA